MCFKMRDTAAVCFQQPSSNTVLHPREPWEEEEGSSAGCLSAVPPCLERAFLKFPANLLSITALYPCFRAQLRSTRCHRLTYLAISTSTIYQKILSAPLQPTASFSKPTTNHIFQTGWRSRVYRLRRQTNPPKVCLILSMCASERDGAK